MIKSLIFDLGGVIVPFDFNRAYRRMEALSGLTPGQIRERLSSSHLGQRLECGRIAPQAFVAEVNGLMGTRLGFGEFRELWVSIFDRQTLIPEDLFCALKNRYRLILLSNTNAIHFDWIVENYPHLNHFDGWVVSHRVGVLKPAPEIYQEAVSQAQCLPQECFFTDDVAAYVEGACRAGMDAVQFRGLEELHNQLRVRGIGL